MKKQTEKNAVSQAEQTSGQGAEKRPEQVPEQKVEQESVSQSEPKGEELPEKTELEQELDKQLASWETRIDEARVQMHLGAKEVEEKIQPHVATLEEEFRQAKQQWGKLEDASEGAWDDIKSGFSLSMKSMEKAFEKAKEHFPDKDK